MMKYRAVYKPQRKNVRGYIAYLLLLYAGSAETASNLLIVQQVSGMLDHKSTVTVTDTGFGVKE